MFQYASLRGIAAYNGYHWQIPSDDVDHKDNYGLFETFEMVNCKPDNLGICNARSVTESNHNFDEALFNTKDGVNIDAYLQTEKYFDTSPIRSVKISPSDQIFSILVKILLVAWIVSSIFLHIRQSDNIGRRSTIPSSRYDIFRIRSHTSQ